MKENLNELCANCGLTRGSHHADHHPFPVDTCPATEGGLDYEQGPGTIFEPTGKYKVEEPDEFTKYPKNPWATT